MDKLLLQELKAYIDQNIALDIERKQELIKERATDGLPERKVSSEQKGQISFKPQRKLPYQYMDTSAFRLMDSARGLQAEKETEKDQLDFSAFRRVKTRKEAGIPDRPEQREAAIEPEQQEATFESKQREAAFEQEQQPVFCIPGSEPVEEDIEEYIRKLRSEDTFSTRLLKYIDLTGLSDADIYKRAGIDRRHFSKIRCDRGYKPKKATALALCLALRLDQEKTGELLSLAGYSLSNSDTGDLVVKFCIERGIYDLIDVNEALDYFGQKSIGVLG